MKVACSNILIIPDLLNGKGARFLKCCDWGIMRKSPPGVSAGRRKIHGYGGRTCGSATTALGSVALWRAAMNGMS